MKTANRQIGIRVAKIQDALAPERRYLRRWLWRLNALAVRLRYLLFEGPRLVRECAPDERELEEHEWRRHKQPTLFV